MTTPEVKTIKRDGSRFCVDPVSGTKVPLVTSIVGCLRECYGAHNQHSGRARLP